MNEPQHVTKETAQNIMNLLKAVMYYPNGAHRPNHILRKEGLDETMYIEKAVETIKSIDYDLKGLI